MSKLRAHENRPKTALVEESFWLETVNDVLIVAVTDTAGRILQVNDRFCSISGYSREELLGSNHRILNSGVHDRTFFVDMYRTLRRGRTWRGEICNRAKNGSLYWVATTIIPKFDAAQKIVRYVACRFDITEQKAAQQRLIDIATKDPLTGLLNRYGLQQRLGELLVSASRSEHGLRVLMLDIDHFKDVNDINGHDVGDRVLQIVASRLQAGLAADALIARLGGDEIAAVLPDRGPETDRVIARLQDGIRFPIQIDHTTFSVTASIGSARFPNDGTSTVELIKRADIALYRAKHEGRNRCIAFEASMLEATTRRIVLQEEAALGLARGEFEVFYQPIVASDGSSPASCEALLRWRHREHGLLGPGAFQDVLECPRLMEALGETVRRTVIRQVADWIEAGVPFEKVKFNTAAADFEMPGFARRLLAQLAAQGVPTDRIGIEVTEGLFLGQRSSSIRQELADLHDGGVEIAFDDFGTGFASLTHLREWPISRLKIDRSFVVNIGASERDETIVRSIVALAHALGMVVTAEGVETEEQFLKLVEIGCDRLQGYYFFSVLPAAEAAAALHSLMGKRFDPVADEDPLRLTG